MHELGIIVHVAKQLCSLAEEKKLTKIGSVTLEVGEVSGIVHEYMTDAWNYYRMRIPILKNCEMRFEKIEAITICNSCTKTYETVKYAKICPYCGSEDTVLQKGNECMIKQIEAY